MASHSHSSSEKNLSSQTPSDPTSLADGEIRDIVWEALEHAPDVVLVCSAEGVIEYANGRASAIFGYEPGALLGQPIERLVPDRFRSGHSTHRREYSQDPSPRPMGMGLQLSAKHFDGRDVPVEISLSPVAGGRVIAIVRDTKERRLLLEQIAAQRDHLLLVVEALQDGLAELNADGHFSQINDRLAEMVGRNREELLHHNPSKWLDEHAYARFLNDLRSAGAARTEMVLRHSDGSKLTVSLSGSKILAATGTETFVAVFHDLTVERAAATALANARAKLAIADDRERIARDLHDTVIQRLFATGLSLQAMAGRTEIADRIEAAVVGIDDAIRDLRTSIFTLRRPADLLTVADSLRTTAEEAKRMLHCPLLVEIDPAVDSVVPSSLRDQLVAVVRESLTNVVKHAAARSVELSVTVLDGRLVISVDDDGVGFDLAQQVGGNGLRNLRERAQRLGGGCEIRSRSGNGTTMVFSVPLTNP